MLLNYLKLSLRLLARNPFFTFINVAGLSVGFAVFFVLWQHSTYELKSDQFHKDHNRIYKAYCDFYFAQGDVWTHYIYSTLPPILIKLAKEKNPEVEEVTRLIHQNNFNAIRWRGPQTDTAGYSEQSTQVIISFYDRGGEKYSFSETKAGFADPNFFQFFSLPLVVGTPRDVLNQADAIVLSETTARKYFGQENPVGKTLLLNDTKSFTVTGVFKDIGHNSHLNIDLLFSTLNIYAVMESSDPYQETAVGYFKLSENADMSKLSLSLAHETDLNWPFIRMKSFPGSTVEFHFQPLKDVPFHVQGNDNYVPKSKFKLQLFLIVGFVVLAMAWINYLNLKLSTQASRMKEMAARKTAGAGIIDFMKQFLMESILISVLSVALALTLIQIFKSPLETLLQFYFPDWSGIDQWTLLVFLGVMILGIMIAALHPASVMWKSTIRSMLNSSKTFSERINFIKITSVIQFIGAIVLIVWLTTTFSQVSFIMKDSWGVNRDGVIVIELPENDSIVGISLDVEKFKNELLTINGVEDVAVSSTVTGDLIRNRVGFEPIGHGYSWVVPKSDGGVDERYIPFYDLKILAGRNFMRDNPADRDAVIISREVASSIGWSPEEAIGKVVSVEKYSWRGIRSNAEIIGVIEDHRYSPLYLETSLSESNRGTILTYGNYLFPKNQPLRLSIRVNASKHLIEEIGDKFKSNFPEKIFEWHFLHEHMNVHYQSEQIAQNQVMLFSMVAIGIACLGLLGMISNKANAKVKEIGIRKVLGARVSHIGQILLNTTIKQIGIAILFGIPISFILTRQYLQKFSERVDLNWWHFALPVAILILIMLATVGTVVWKAAKSNPVEALKYE